MAPLINVLSRGTRTLTSELQRSLGPHRVAMQSQRPTERGACGLNPAGAALRTDLTRPYAKSATWLLICSMVCSSSDARSRFFWMTSGAALATKPSLERVR